MRRLLESGNATQIVGVPEAFSPARSAGPEWTRSFDVLAERLWTWCDASTLAAVESEFRSRGPSWAAVANALTPQRGKEIQAQLRRGFRAARLPAFTLG